MGVCSKKGCKIDGIRKVESARERLMAGMPREGRSAKLSKEGTYDGDIHNLIKE